MLFGLIDMLSVLIKDCFIIENLELKKNFLVSLFFVRMAILFLNMETVALCMTPEKELEWLHSEDQVVS